MNNKNKINFFKDDLFFEKKVASPFNFAFKTIIIVILSFFCLVQPVQSQKSIAKANEKFNQAEKLLGMGEFKSSYILLDSASVVLKKNHQIREYILCLFRLAEINDQMSNNRGELINIDEAEKWISKLYPDDNDLMVSLLLHKGLYHIRMGNLLVSMNELKQALDRKNALNEKKDSLYIALERLLGVDYYLLGENEKAYQIWGDALKIKLSVTKKPDLLLAKLYDDMGLCLSEKGEYDKARDFLENELKIYKTILKDNNILITDNYINFSYLYMSCFHDPDKAVEYLLLAEKIIISNYGANSNLLSTIYLNLSDAFIAISEPDKSIKYLEDIQRIYKINNYDNPLEIAKLYSRLGNAYTCFDENEQSLYYFKECEKIIKKYKIKLDWNIDYFLAINYGKLNQNLKAIAYFEKAILSAKKNPVSNSDLANVYRSFGMFWLGIHENSKAISCIDKSYKLSVFAMGPKDPITSLSLREIGNYWMQVGRPDKALDFYQRSIISVLPAYNDSNVYHNPVIAPGKFKQLNCSSDIILLRSMTYKGNALRAFGESCKNKNLKIIYLQTALRCYELCVTILESMRFGFSSEESRLDINDYHAETYCRAVESATELYKTTGNRAYAEKAFVYAERGKASNLLAVLRGNNAVKFSGVPDSLINLEKDLQRDISVYEELENKEKAKKKPDPALIKKYESKSFTVYKQKELLSQNMRKKYPSYYNLKYSNEVDDISLAQSKLSKNEALLEYVFSSKQITVFAICKNDFKIYTCPADGQIERDISIVRKFISSDDVFNLKTEGYINFQDASNHLFHLVFSPLDPFCTGKKLIVVPDGKLNYIPFESLLSTNMHDKEFRFSRLDWLIKKYTFSYAYSATLRSHQVKKDKRVNGGLLAVAPDYLSYQRLGRDSLLKNLYFVPLKGTVAEVLDVSKIFNGKVLTGEEASERNFKSMAGNYNILHLAMHSSADDENPLLTKLVFTANNDTAEDGFLNTYEIYNLKLNADLTVLSACNTGNGKMMRGEGIMSMARAFIYAGCPAIIMTLWPAGDDSGSELMQSFYKYLKKGKMKDEALRLAKLDYLQNADPISQHPYYWTSYVAVGDISPICSDYRLKYCIIAGIAIFLLAFIIIKKKRN
jgi:CHAT domain-containing protein